MLYSSFNFFFRRTLSWLFAPPPGGGGGAQRNSSRNGQRIFMISDIRKVLLKLFGALHFLCQNRAKMFDTSARRLRRVLTVTYKVKKYLFMYLKLFNNVVCDVLSIALNDCIKWIMICKTCGRKCSVARCLVIFRHWLVETEETNEKCH